MKRIEQVIIYRDVYLTSVTQYRTYFEVDVPDNWEEMDDNEKGEWLTDNQAELQEDAWMINEFDTDDSYVTAQSDGWEVDE